VADGTAGSDLRISARIGNGSLIKAGAGTLALSGANTYAGQTTVNAGTLLISNDSALGTTAADTTVSAGATLALSGVRISENLQIGSLVGLWCTGTTNSVVNGNILLTADTGIELDQIGTIAGVISDGGDGYGIQTTSGTLYLTNANTYRGGTTVLGGEVVLLCSTGTAILGDVTLGDGVGAVRSAVLNQQYASQLEATANVTTYADGWFYMGGSAQTVASITMTGGTVNIEGGCTLTLAGNATTLANASAATISGDLSLGGGTRTFTVADGAAASDLLISAAITNGALTKAGAGTMQLGGVNTFSGQVEIAAGTLQVAADANLGAAPGEFTADAIVFSGGTLLAGATFTLNANRGMQLDASTNSTLQTAGGVTLTYNGLIAGAGTLAFDGSGTVSMGHTSIGATTLAGGTLRVNGTLSAASFVAQSLGTLDFALDSGEAGLLPASAMLDVTAAVTLGDSLLVLESDQTYTGGSEVTLISAAGGVTGVFSNASDGSIVQATGSEQFFRIHITDTQVVAETVYVQRDLPGFYDAETSTFYLRDSNTTGAADLSFGYGEAGAGWIPVVGDWNGDGIQTIGLFDPTASVFYLRNSNSTGNADLCFGYGAPGAGWTPLVGDWNGDGIDTIGLYDAETATWYLRNSNSMGTADLTFGYGAPGSTWTPVIGDWDGNRTDTIGLYDGETATWYLRNSNSMGMADLTFGYGAPGAGWTPVTGDWTASGNTTIGLYDTENATWLLRNTNSAGYADITFGFGSPASTWQPITGDWLGAPLEEVRSLSAAAVDQIDLDALTSEAIRGIS
jgi:autotransporter-associated beta strand protein